VEGRGDPIDEESPSPPRERRLRDLIADSPSLLRVAGRPTAVSTEVGISGAGLADVVVVDADGEITVVECKLITNKEIRRKVIGQLFEYAAALWKLDIKDFERSLLAGGTASRNASIDSVRWQETQFRSNVSSNLDDGAFRLIIAVDEITERLKRTVVFINHHTRPEVRFLALELRRAGEAGGPRPVAVFYGDNDEEIRPRKPRWRRKQEALLKGIRRPDAARAAGGLLDWAEGKDLAVSYTRKKQDRLETGTILTPGGDRLFRIKEHRVVRVSFEALRHDDGDEDRISQLVQGLAKIDARFQIDTKRKGERPEAPLESLAQESKREEFLVLMEQVLKTPDG
jgi:hypothetical protein